MRRAAARRGFRPKSMPAVTPPSVMTHPPVTTRWYPMVAPKSGREIAHIPVRGRSLPLRRPVALRASEPVQTLVT